MLETLLRSVSTLHDARTLQVIEISSNAHRWNFDSEFINIGNPIDITDVIERDYIESFTKYCAGLGTAESDAIFRLCVEGAVGWNRARGFKSLNGDMILITWNTTEEPNSINQRIERVIVNLQQITRDVTNLQHHLMNTAVMNNTAVIDMNQICEQIAANIGNTLIYLQSL